MKVAHEKPMEKQKFSMQLADGDLVAITRGTHIILENPDSETLLEVAEGVKAIVKLSNNTELMSMKEIIPENECLVSPVVHFEITETGSSNAGHKYKATIPHIASSDQLSSLKVKTGDIQKPESMQEVKKDKPEKPDEPYYRVNPGTVTLNSSSVCDVMCTSDQKMCTSKILAVPFGCIQIDENANGAETNIEFLTSVKVKTLLCNHLYSYPVYRDVSTCLLLHYQKLPSAKFPNAMFL